MKLTDSKAKELQEKTLSLNKQIEEYRRAMEKSLKDLEDAEDNRVQTMIDALNQMNIFQTNCDMNNKYDSNNFYQNVEEINVDETKKEFKRMWAEADLYSIDTYAFHPFDELMSKDDYQLHKLEDSKEKEHRRDIKAFIDQCRQADFNPDDLHREEFKELMNSKVNRFCFVSILQNLDSYELPNENCFKGMACLVGSFLKGCNIHSDCEYLRNIIMIAGKLHYDVQETEDAVIRTSLTEAIRRNKIWDNADIWGKAIFKDFRDIIRKFKIPDGQEGDFNKEDILRNVLFNRLNFYISNLVYFDMDGNTLTMMCNRFSKVYKFTPDQTNKLKKKVATCSYTENCEDYFTEEVKEERSKGSITKKVGTWMSRLEKFGTSAVTKMKTYIKKKEIDEDPVLDLHDEQAFDEDYRNNVESTDASKNNSEGSPPKDCVYDIQKEVDLNDVYSSSVFDPTEAQV